MKTPVCPACGCSLVRLGISKDNAIPFQYKQGTYLFCCEGCLDSFAADPEKYLSETKDVVVCPTCLGEKPLHLTVKIEFAGQQLFFCRCPHCLDEFTKNPEHFMRRLEILD